MAGGDIMFEKPILALGMPGIPEMLLIALVILLLFGAKRLPELARGLGKGIREFRGAVSETSDQLKQAMDEPEKPASGADPASPQAPKTDETKPDDSKPDDSKPTDA
jgi:sec-independent protein translocase protein TatA